MDYLSQHMQTILVAAVALVLILVAIIAWRTLSPRVAGRRGQRLGISEYYEVDKSRRLVLVRRDNVEHLILIGGGHDLVIEPDITAAAIASAYTPTPVTPDQANFRPSPRAPSFSDRRSAPQTGRRDEPEL